MSVKANVCLFAPQSEYQYHFNELLQLYSSFFSFCWLFSTYESKSAFFDSLAVLGNATKPTAKENANAFLDRALRGRSIVIEAETNRLTSAGENGGLSKKTTDEEIENMLQRWAITIKPRQLYNAPAGFGSTASEWSNYTERYGDMRSYESGGAVQQRADNTRLSNASILHNHATAATSSSEEDALDWAIHDSLMEQKRLYDSAAVMMPPVAPMKSTAAFTPGGGEEDEQRGIVLQGVVDGLTKPPENQIEKAHGLLEREGKEASE
jgi:hypothetical protein